MLRLTRGLFAILCLSAGLAGALPATAVENATTVSTNIVTAITNSSNRSKVMENHTQPQSPADINSTTVMAAATNHSAVLTAPTLEHELTTDTSNATNSFNTTSAAVPKRTWPFDETYVVNLDEATEKWDLLHNQLEAAGWPHTRFAATNGFNKYGKGMEGVEASSKLLHSEHLMGSGERGHFETFHRIFEDIVARNLTCAMIIEDDQEFTTSKGQVGIVRNYMLQLQEYDPNWDIVWFHWKPMARQNKLLYVDPFLKPSEFDHAELEEDVNVAPNLWRTGPSYGTWAFAVSNNGTRKLLDFLSEQYTSTDYQIARLNAAYPRKFADPCTKEVMELPEFRSYGFKPMLFKAHFGNVLSLFTSDIGWLREVVHHQHNPHCDNLAQDVAAKAKAATASSSK